MNDTLYLFLQWFNILSFIYGKFNKIFFSATKHYSPKTLKTYTHWLKKFQAFAKSRFLESLSDKDIKEFLTFLAVERKVAASTKNQAFNALLFLFRHVLGKEPGDLKNAVRTKRKPYIPVVYSMRP